MVQFRKSKSVGPFRMTVSKKGVSTSVGAKGARASLGADGKVRSTVGLPGTGIYDTKVVGSVPGTEKTPDTGSAPPSPLDGVVFGQPPAWLTEILARPSDAPLASVHQRAHVAVELQNQVANGDLKGMRLDHAVAILQHVGADPAGLRAQNRDGLGGSKTKERKAWWKEHEA